MFGQGGGGGFTDWYLCVCVLCSFGVLKEEHTTSISIIALERDEGAECSVVHLQLVSSLLKPGLVLEKQSRDIAWLRT